MANPAPVIDGHASFEEILERMAAKIGTSELRRRILSVIYGRVRRPQTVEQICTAIGSSSGTDKQQVRNHVNYLAKNHLVTKEKAAGNTYGYGKMDFVSANKARLFRLASSPSERNALPTRRRPASALIAATAPTRGRASAMGRPRPRASLDILYLTASPASQEALRADAEVRAVQNEVRGAKFRDRVRIAVSPAADAGSLMQGLNDHRPQVVHFSGHAGGQALWMDDGRVDRSVGSALKFDVLAEILNATDEPPVLLVLNACDTLNGATALLSAVRCVVAMSDSVTDLGATVFATKFYGGIGAGQSVLSAFNQGRAAMKAATLADADLPTPLYGDDLDPSMIVLVKQRRSWKVGSSYE